MLMIEDADFRCSGPKFRRRREVVTEKRIRCDEESKRYIPAVPVQPNRPMGRCEEYGRRNRDRLIENASSDQEDNGAGDHTRYDGQQFCAPVSDTEEFQNREIQI